MTTTLRIALAASAAAALVSIASAQITTPIPPTNLFSDPGPPNDAQFATDLGSLYFQSSADVPSVIQGWNAGPVDFNAALGGNPFNAQGGTVSVIFLGKTASWENDFLYNTTAAQNTFNPLITSIQDETGNPDTNIHPGFETQVNYAAGTKLDFFLNSGGDPTQGGLFSTFGTGMDNQFAGGDTSSHIHWSVKDVTTTYFNGVSTVTTEVPTLLVGYEDTRQGISFYDGDFNDLVMAFQFLPTQNPVPEPSTYGLIGAVGLLGLVAFRRLKRQAA